MIKPSIPKEILFVFLFISMILQSKAQNNSSSKDEDVATVIFYRKGEFFAAASNYSIYANEDKICKLSNNKYLSYKAKPGRYTFNAKHGGAEVFKKETALDLDVEAGKTYYVSCEVKQSITRDRLEMEEVTENTASKDLKGMTEDHCDEESGSN